MRFPQVRMKNPIRFMSLLRASCSPNVSQQSIWASHRRAAESDITAGRGVNSRRICEFSLGRDENSNSKRLM